MKSVICLLFILLFACSCGTKEVPTLNSIDVESALDDMREKLYIQDFFSQVDYLPLETTDSSVIGAGGRRLIVSDEAILISVLGKEVKLFDRGTGKYVRNIGHVGDDPQGYSNQFYMAVFLLDQAQGIVYLPGWKGDYQMYDLEGNYRGRFDGKTAEGNHFLKGYNDLLINQGQIWGHRTGTDSPEETPSLFRVDISSKKMEYIGTWETPVIPNDNVERGEMLFRFDVDYGGDVDLLRFSKDVALTLVYNGISLWKHQDAIRVKRAFNDTIYTVSQDGIQPYLYFSLGNRHLDEKLRFRPGDMSGTVSIDYVLENDDYIYFHFHPYPRGKGCGFYNKKSGEVVAVDGDRLFDKETDQPVQIRTVAPDGTFVALLDVEKCNEATVERLKLDEEDNPVIVLMR